MNKYEWKDIGAFQMTTTDMAVSDPCYELGTWCAGELHNCLPGEWEAMIGISDEGEGDQRVAILVVRAKGHAAEPLNALKTNGNCGSYFRKADFVIGVDSGQAGFFDKAFYGKDAGIDPASLETDFSGWGEGFSLFYKACCDNTLRREGGVLHCGAVSNSGYGDGGYSGYYHATDGKVDMAFIQFI